MSLFLSKPKYGLEPIRSVASLGRALALSEKSLVFRAASAGKQYSLVRPEPGATRETFNAWPQLKAVHQRIKDEILLRVDFPEYLTGSIRGRDYICNAALHTNKRILICEDVKSFFPSISSDKVYDVWLNFFGFSKDVSSLLTQLTTKGGFLPQGAIPSSYLANLILFRDEPMLQAKFAARGIIYSRYVDDMCLSCETFMSKEEQTKAIAEVYGMLRRNGLRAGRKKHQVFDSSERMIATKIVVNTQPSWPRQKRDGLRAQVFQLEKRIDRDTISSDEWAEIEKVSRAIGQMKRFHPAQAEILKDRIVRVRGRVLTVTFSTGSLYLCEFSSD